MHVQASFFACFFFRLFFSFFFWKPPLFGVGVFSVVVLVQLSFNHVGHSFVGSKRFFLFSVHHGEKGFQPQQQSKFFFHGFQLLFSQKQIQTHTAPLSGATSGNRSSHPFVRARQGVSQSVLANRNHDVLLHGFSAAAHGSEDSGAVSYRVVFRRRFENFNRGGDCQQQSRAALALDSAQQAAHVDAQDRQLDENSLFVG